MHVLSFLFLILIPTSRDTGQSRKGSFVAILMHRFPPLQSAYWRTFVLLVPHDVGLVLLLPVLQGTPPLTPPLTAFAGASELLQGKPQSRCTGHFAGYCCGAKQSLAFTHKWKGFNVCFAASLLCLDLACESRIGFDFRYC